MANNYISDDVRKISYRLEYDLLTIS